MERFRQREPHIKQLVSLQFSSVPLSNCHTKYAPSEAMQQMSNLEVEVSMSCMVVEIERPWLHAELFADAELDSGK